MTLPAMSVVTAMSTRVLHDLEYNSSCQAPLLSLVPSLALAGAFFQGRHGARGEPADGSTSNSLMKHRPNVIQNRANVLFACSEKSSIAFRVQVICY